MDIITIRNTTYLLNPNYAAHFQAEHFEPAWWQAQNAVVGQSHGRGITWFVQLGQQQGVLRHYYRGGWLGKLLHDRYWFTGWQRSRAADEFRLLQTMQAQGLPVPTPWAARIQRYGLFYRADLLLQRIPDAHDVVSVLRTRPLSRDEWHTLGQTLQHLHRANIDHADLNSHNLLLDKAGKAWVIDFDKGKQHPAGGAWQVANMQRLQRSFRKELRLNPALHWQESDWQLLLEGYGNTFSKA